jgi:methylmalonyl-CoA/ethylmalonyl-CoA epimerase
MGQKPVFEKIMQVAVVVRDIDASVRKWSDVYGIGPWSIYELGPGRITDLRVRGEPAGFSMKIALTYIGNVEIELIEPLDERSIYAEFLSDRGEGLHHLGLATSPGADLGALFSRRGIEAVQSGRWSNEKWTYYDASEDLGFIFELFEREGAGDFVPPEPDEKYPSDGTKP